METETTHLLILNIKIKKTQTEWAQLKEHNRTHRQQQRG